ncbi:J domain-containing protein [Frankia sp. CNm7]|uniref:J domain-containing protein n=1 Tax=Frankia nepalensis TaxID=1836974 RepID=A0A937RDZ9_9ACTN|nr:DnaJ domain-containing protein [Frankia nepalensis]MBL7495766.1 J domain-containing protein [Frankia nepalensis]MBL7513009.1 J domain-containing protein [Frankia nepalensis]MBL7523631.1 J domain-containing protein [Frankia nepalensis]MBL7627124.1 J domain-containing protein [Frankia nepalensis]
MNTLSRLLRELSDDDSQEFLDACRRLGIPRNTVLNPYQVLRAPEDASPQVIKKAWRRRAQEFHPDRAGRHDSAATRIMQLLSAAHLILTKHREEYDAISARRDIGSLGADEDLSATAAHDPADTAEPSESEAGGLWASYGRPYSGPRQTTTREATAPTYSSGGWGYGYNQYEYSRGNHHAGYRYRGLHWVPTGAPGMGYWSYFPSDTRAHYAPYYRPHPSAWARPASSWQRRLRPAMALYSRVRATGDRLFFLSAPFWLYGMFIACYLTLEIYYRANATQVLATPSHYLRIGYGAVVLLAAVVLAPVCGKIAVLIARDRSRPAYLAWDLAITSSALLVALWGIFAMFLKVADHRLWYSYGFPSLGWPVFFP